MSKLFVIDQGHGGKDVGASYHGLHEKDITLELGNRVAKGLAAYDCSYKLTRQGDEYVGLLARAQFANSHKASFLLSIHANADAKQSGTGFESYIHTSAGKDTEEIQNLIHIEAAKVFRQYDLMDRGKKRANFAVLRETSMPAVLLECGFISNPKDNKLMRDERFLDDVANGIVAGLVGAFRLVRKQPKDDRAIAIDTLVKAGVISSPDYWLTNAIPSKHCDGGYVASLIQKIAAKLR